ncbi:MAG: tetratricopeptide repeat protein [Candidatus Goldiibacteriota bacterium]|jgi:TolA-binding protein
MRKNVLTIIITAALTAPFLLAAQGDKSQYDLANSLYLNSNYRLAGPLFESFTDERPDDPLAGDAKFMAGEAEYAAGEYKKAISAFTTIIERYSTAQNKYRKELYYRLAECFYRVKDYEKSTEYINILLKEYPGSYLTADAWLLLGENYFLSGKYEEAIDALNRLDNFTEYHHFDYVYYLKGRIFYEKGLQEASDKEKDFLEAVKYFDRIKKEFPDSPIMSHAEFRKANALYSMGKYPEAVTIITSLIDREQDPKFKTLMKYLLAWNYYMEGQYKKAVSIYVEITTSSPNDLLAAWSEFKEGLCLEALNDPKGALAKYSLVADKYPDTVPAAYAQYAAGQYYYNSKNYYDAAAQFAQVVEKYNVEEITRAALFLEADSDIMLSNYGKAKDIYTDLEKRSPQDAYEARYMRGWCLYKEANYEESIKLFGEICADEKAPAEIKGKSLIKTGDNYYELNNMEKAELNYDAAIKQYSSERGVAAEAYYAKGWILYGMDKNSEARALFEKVKQLASDKETRLRADFMRANTLYGDYKFDEAFAIYGSILSDKGAPQSMKDDSLFYSAWCRYRKEKFTEAAALWQKYLGQVADPVKKAEALYRIGWTYFRTNDYDKAIKEFTIITESYKETHFLQEALLKIGDSYYNKKDYDRAISFYKIIVDKYPSHYRVGEALYGIQWSYYQLNQPEKAIELSKQFVEKYPDSSFAPEIQYRIAEHYYNTCDYSTAAAEFGKFIHKNPNDKLVDNAYYWLGVCHEDLKDFAAAVNAYKELIAKFPASPFAEKAMFKSGGCFYKLHDYTNACATYLAFIDKYKVSTYMPEAYFNLAMSYKRSGDLQNTEAWYKKLISEFPQSTLFEKAHMNLGYMYQDNKEYEKAIAVFKEAAAMKREKGAEAQYWVADSYNSEGDTQNALAQYIKTADDFKADELWSVSALDAAGKIYEKNGELQSAINIYKRILTVTKQPKYTETAQKTIELLEEQYKLLHPAGPVRKKAAVK